VRAKKRKHRRILFRTVGMAWLIVLFTVAIFITAVIPYQRRQLVAEMRQRALVVYTSTAQVTKDSRTLYLQLGMIAALAVSAGFFLSLLYARRLSIPILNLERFAHRIAIGDLSRRIDIRTGDEIEQLAHSFNYMVDALQQAKQEGKVAQQQLVQTARQAGMAEMMSNVLHNVGNVLNSVGVTTSTTPSPESAPYPTLPL
jgi:nitrogen fixation/metabolism regulation signal transduction histidine kinase